MVLVTSKTSAGRAAVVPRSPRGGGGEEGMGKRLSQALGARHRNSGTTRPEGNRTTRRTLLASVASTPVAVRRSSGVCVASAGRLVPRCVSGVCQLMTPLRGAVACSCGGGGGLHRG